jgi:hypothetical protein
MVRKPKGYVGSRHETIGSDILSVLQIFKLPAQVLGEAEACKLAAIDPAKWYPIEWLLDLMEKVETSVGRYALLQLGRTIFKRSHEEKALQVLKSGRDIIYGLDSMYRNANRGRNIGGWHVQLFEAGYAELEKTTPHHCVMEQGILSAAFAAVGCPVSLVQSACFRKGADSCVYTITSSVTDERWCGITPAPFEPRER